MANKYFMRTTAEGKKVKSDAPFNEDIQKAVSQKLVAEFSVAKRNMDPVHKRFEDAYKLLHCEDESGKKDFMESYVKLPEYQSRFLTAISNFVNQYFGSRDFVDTYTESTDPIDAAESKASKTLLNTLLNEPEAHYYHKISRTLAFSFMSHAIIKGGYRQEVRRNIVGYNSRWEFDRNEDGEVLVGEDGQPSYTEINEPQHQDEVVYDRPVFDVYPITDVFYSPEFTYTLNEKKYVVFRSEVPLSELRETAGQYGYFNLDILDEKSKETLDEKRADKTYGRNKSIEDAEEVDPNFILLERWGKYPVVIKETDPATGKPSKVEPGIDADGNWKKDAELQECIITRAYRNGQEQSTIIRFQISPHSKRPMVRFICYVDPINDDGFSDSEGVKLLENAQNETFNLTNFRTQLATTPAFIGKKWTNLPAQIEVRPDKLIEVENVQEDIRELQITDNIQGGLQTMGLLSGKIDDLMAIYSHTRGGEGDRRETATMGSIMDSRASIRMNLKNLNFEFIGFTEFYDMILTLCNDFMLPETLEQLIGDQARFYNPKRRDRFIPVTQALESEASKANIIKMYTQILGMVSGIQNPKTPFVINYILGEILERAGNGFKHFKKFMFEEDPRINLLYFLATGSKANTMQNPMQGPQGPGGAQAPMGPAGPPPSNQRMLPQSGTEQLARGTL